MKRSALWMAISLMAVFAAFGIDQRDAKGSEDLGIPPSPSRDLRDLAPLTATVLETFDCGGKNQKPCPMQGWMKTVMSAAAASGDGAKLATALAYVAARPPPGMTDWTAISSAAADKAKAGDIEAAKTACKKCHELYKTTYKETMRDRSF